MKIQKVLWVGCSLLLASCKSTYDCALQPSSSDLVYPSLATTWDEGIPLGNATVGALVWQKGDVLRLSLDRTDLWDLRPSDSLSGPNYKFSWVKEHVRSKNYRPVQLKFDAPYDRSPAPSKIPGAALEFPMTDWGKASQVRLYLNNALCEVEWANGVRLETFVHATKPVGWFVFKNLKKEIEPELVLPRYATDKHITTNSPVTGQDLRKLGYEQGKAERNGNQIVYHQPGYGDFAYDVTVKWEQKDGTLYGTWSISTTLSEEKAVAEAQNAMKRGFLKDFDGHMAYWNNYWKASSVSLPDSVLQQQYDREMYKYGSATREYSYPISLQAVWTADNGKLPPWKGDYHHDLNTQLSYWPTYIGNHLTEGLGYINTLWNQRDTYKRYTRQYFEADGLNIPGVCTLTGEPMGGWIQYAMSQTVSSWLAQHFYLHWKYSADREFLKNRAYPFLKDVAIFLEQISIVDENGVRKLEFSSSPEIFDNSLKAWFKNMTNYDLGLMKFLFKATAELATELDLKEEAAHWQQIGAQLPDFDLDEDGALTFSKGFPYANSHRHFSHAMAFHPLGLIDWSDGEKAQNIIKATVKKLEDFGPNYWVGYSYTWLANMYARMFEGEKAAETLRTFAQCFCLKNTFHANGDQSGTGKSLFRYRPFTLEGNFAFASAVQEMLLQSHTGVIKVFPSIPSDWKNASFTHLRAMGAFLVDAKMENGQVVQLTVYSERGGEFKLLSPETGKVEHYQTQPGQILHIIG